MSWNVTYKRKLERNLNKLPMEVQALFQVLVYRIWKQQDRNKQVGATTLNLEAISIIAI